MRPCRDCGKPVNRAGNVSGAPRCRICEAARVMRDWSYTPDPYAVVAYREDEAAWATREPAPVARCRCGCGRPAGQARGLAEACYQRAMRAGVLDRLFPRTR